MITPCAMSMEVSSSGVEMAALAAPRQPCPCLLRCRYADVRVTCVLHDGGNVREVQVDEARNGDELGDVLNCLTQNAVSDLECVLEGDLLLGYILQTLVRDDDEGVYVLVQLVDAGERLLETLALALESEKGLVTTPTVRMPRSRAISPQLEPRRCRCRRPYRR